MSTAKRHSVTGGPLNLPVKYDQLAPAKRKAVREEYVRLQDGLCHFCGCALTGPPAEAVAAKTVNHRLFPDGFFNHPVHLHHSHDSGLTLGAVHNYCNAVLWQYHGE